MTCENCKFKKELTADDSDKTCKAGKNMGRATVTGKCKFKVEVTA